MYLCERMKLILGQRCSSSLLALFEKVRGRNTKGVKASVRVENIDRKRHLGFRLCQLIKMKVRVKIKLPLTFLYPQRETIKKYIYIPFSLTFIAPHYYLFL